MDTLYDADTAEPIGPATPEQVAASDAAGDEGIILVDGDSDVVAPGGFGAEQARRCYTMPA